MPYTLPNLYGGNAATLAADAKKKAEADAAAAAAAPAPAPAAAPPTVTTPPPTELDDEEQARLNAIRDSIQGSGAFTTSQTGDASTNVDVISSTGTMSSATPDPTTPSVVTPPSPVFGNQPHKEFVPQTNATVDPKTGGYIFNPPSSMSLTGGDDRAPLPPDLDNGTSAGGGGGLSAGGEDNDPITADSELNFDDLWGNYQSEMDDYYGRIDSGEEDQLGTLDDMKLEHEGQLGGRIGGAEDERLRADRAMANRRAGFGGPTTGGGAESENRQLSLDSQRLQDSVRRQHGQEALQFGKQRIALQGQNLNRKMSYLKQMAEQARAQGNLQAAQRFRLLEQEAETELMTLEMAGATSAINAANP